MTDTPPAAGTTPPAATLPAGDKPPVDEQSTSLTTGVPDNAPEKPGTKPGPFAHGKQATLAQCRAMAKKNVNVPAPTPIMSINEANRRAGEIVAKAKAQAGAMK